MKNLFCVLLLALLVIVPSKAYADGPHPAISPSEVIVFVYPDSPSTHLIPLGSEVVYDSFRGHRVKIQIGNSVVSVSREDEQETVVWTGKIKACRDGDLFSPLYVQWDHERPSMSDRAYLHCNILGGVTYLEVESTRQDDKTPTSLLPRGTVTFGTSDFPRSALTGQEMKSRRCDNIFCEPSQSESVEYGTSDFSRHDLTEGAGYTRRCDHLFCDED